jgi:hypothetical protein
MRSRTRLSMRRLRRGPQTYNNAVGAALLLREFETFGEADFNAKVAAWCRGDDVVIGQPYGSEGWVV